MEVLKITIAAARVNAGLTQKQLAEQCGVSESTVISWEAGKTLPNASLLGKFERAVGISLNHIRFEKRK